MWNDKTGMFGRETKGEVVLVDRLRAALTQLNSSLPSAAIQTAIDEITRDRSAMSLEAATVFCAANGVDLAAMEALTPGTIERLSAMENAINALISPDSLRHEFFVHEKLVTTLYRAVKPDPAALEFAERVAGISALAGSIRTTLNPDTPDITGIMSQVCEVLDDSIAGTKIDERGSPAIDLSKINFKALAKRFKQSAHKNTDLEILKAAIKAKLEKLVRLNRTRADFAEKFESLIESYPERNAGVYADVA